MPSRFILGVVALATLACTQRHDVYVIGAASPQQLEYGMQNQRGITLAVEEINRAGGINGTPLRVVTRDDKGDAVQAVKVAQAFVADPAILAVIGHANSSAMMSAAHVYDQGQLVALATAPSSPDLTGISPWVFRMITSDSVNGITLAHFAATFADTIHHRVRAAILYTNDAYGRGLADAFQRNFAGDIISADPVSEDADFEPFVAYLKSRNPDLVFVASDEQVGLNFLHEAHKQHFATRFLGGDGWQGVAADSIAEGVYVGAPFSAQNTDTATQHFVRAFYAKFGRMPDAHAALAYDATRLIAQAIAREGNSRSAIRTYLSGLTPTTAFHGATGVTRFAETNDPVGDHFRVTRVQHGLLVPVESAE